jgi:hypothetical protein
MNYVMVRRLVLAALVVATLTGTAAAQQPTQPLTGGDDQTMLLGLGVTVLAGEGDAGIGFGANALFNALETNEDGRLGIVGDFGLNDLEGSTALTVMAGPRFTFNTAGRVLPYAQFLVGLAHSYDDTDFLPALGAGIDVAWRPNMNVRGELQFLLGDWDATRLFVGISLPINKR